MKKTLVLGAFLLFIANTSFAVFTFRATVEDVLTFASNPELEYDLVTLNSEKGRACIQEIINNIITDSIAVISPNFDPSHKYNYMYLMSFIVRNCDGRTHR